MKRLIAILLAAAGFALAYAGLADLARTSPADAEPAAAETR